MQTLREWTVDHHDAHGLHLRVENRHLLRLQVLDHGLIRVQLLRDGAWRLPRSWSVAPGADVPWSGRSRDATDGFPCPPVHVTDAPLIETDQLRVTVQTPLALRWDCRAGPGAPWQPLAQDRATGAYQLGALDTRVAHYMAHDPDDQIFGLGEKSGPLDRAGGRYEMRNLDALGYDAARTDPLYKHLPVTFTPRAGAGVLGLFYDNLSTVWFDLGNELDNYHAPYRHWRAEDGDLDLYVSWAPDLMTAVQRHTALTGGTAFPPRWSLGYSASSMAYTDAPDAQAQMDMFLDRIKSEGIPCDSFQMSSGYTSIGPRRYVFNWNTDKFPDFPALAARFADQGVRLIANIKPVLLDDHPAYDTAAPLMLSGDHAPFWDGMGSHLDFTNPATVEWWKQQVTQQLLDRGVASTWNDNNEFGVWDDTVQAHGFGDPIPIRQIRPVMGLLMTRASDEAQRAAGPGTRPFMISRSAAPGTQRYAQSWTGDNRTSWDTLRWNIPMGLGLSLSGLYNIGHDVGGFAGDRPDPELFLRWVQNGVLHPRFTIHSWNDDGTVNEPWMHRAVTPLVRDAIRLRYRLLPYLYTQLYRAAVDHIPILRPLMLDFPDDPQVQGSQFDYLLGPDLLVASVIDPGATTRRVTLPNWPGGWWHWDSATWHPGGTIVDLPVTLASIPLFIRGGAVLPLSHGAGRADPQAEARRIALACPAPDGPAVQSMMYDDDGASDPPQGWLTRFTLDRDHLTWRGDGPRLPHFDRFELHHIAGAPLTINQQPCASGQMHPVKG